MRADHHVFEHCEPRKESEVLERPRDASVGDFVGVDCQQVFAIEHDLTGIRFVDPRHDVEQRRLAGAVRADQTADLVLIDRERQLVERDDAPEPYRHLMDVK